MSSGWAAVAWALSVLPFLAERLGGESLAIPGASRAGLVLLPWIALAGLPRRSAAPGALPWTATTAFVLPPLALGAGLDILAGAARGEVLGRCLVGGTLVALLALGAELAGEAGRRLHAVLWLVLVPGSAALLAALAWIGAPGTGSPPVLLAELACCHPLVWAHRAARAEPLLGAAGGLRPLLLVGLLALAANLARRLPARAGRPG
ncbi:MAG: hypothetical protein AB1726_06210 [Planctomycetota bacterium]